MSDLNHLRQDLKSYLSNKKIHVLNCIREYPPPIPACDTQFNYLLHKRDQLTIELNRLQKVDDDDVAEFVSESIYLDDVFKDSIQSQIQSLLRHK